MILERLEKPRVYDRNCSAVSHRGQSTFVDTPASVTGGATSDRYPSVVADTSAVTVTNQSRSRSAVRAREYERELERTGAVTREASTSLERRPKSSSPML